MKLFRDFDLLPECFRGGAVSIGNFDGVHRGHAQLIERLTAMARHVGGPVVVFTFDPHPAQLLRPQAAPTPLEWTERNAQLLGELGVDAVIAYPTDRAFLQIGARQFFDEIVLGRLDARAMVEGANFFFGHDRAGNIDLLRQFCTEAGMSFDVVEPVVIDGAIVSSSRVRSLVASGNVTRARSLLGRPYRIHGVVGHGAGRGKELGYPTANLEQIDTLMPADGTYAGLVLIEGDKYPAAVSVGPNLTFDDDRSKVEAHLIGYTGSLYEKVLEVDFLVRLRDTKKFDSADALVAQIKRDVEEVQAMVVVQ